MAMEPATSGVFGAQVMVDQLPSIRATAGSTVTFHCSFSYNGTVEAKAVWYKWFKDALDGYEVSNTTEQFRGRVRLIRTYIPQKKITIELWNISQQDSGTYFCQVGVSTLSTGHGNGTHLHVEVCISFLSRFYQSLQDNDVEFSSPSIEKELLKTCNEAKGKENRLCYYIGATSDAATKITNEVSKPMSNHIPPIKICEKLKKKDGQICELKYDKQIDLSTVELKKLRVKDLKKILDDWGETCKGCAEKSDYIRKINELMPKYAPKAASARTDL